MTIKERLEKLYPKEKRWFYNFYCVYNGIMVAFGCLFVPITLTILFASDPTTLILNYRILYVSIAFGLLFIWCVLNKKALKIYRDVQIRVAFELRRLRQLSRRR